VQVAGTLSGAAAVVGASAVLGEAVRRSTGGGVRAVVDEDARVEGPLRFCDGGGCDLVVVFVVPPLSTCCFVRGEVCGGS
jgi:hypothetical protein